MDKLTDIISIKKIIDTGSLEHLYFQWFELWKKSPAATPFQMPDWIIPWWKVFGKGKLFVLSIIYDERLIGLAPFYIYKLKDTETRQLTLIGTGNTDYLDVVAEAGYEEHIAEAISSYLSEQSAEWDICYFQGISDASVLRKLKLSGSYSTTLMDYNIYPEKKLPFSFDEYVSSLSTDFRKKIRYAQNSLLKSGKLYYESADDQTYKKFLDDLFFLHKKSWNMRNEDGVLNGEKIREFHEKAADGLLKNGILRLYRLKHNSRTAAIIYGMIKERCFYYYLSGFDPEMKKYSPGSILILFMMEDLMKQGIRTFDFMMGGEAYKYRWGAKDKMVYKMIINKL